MSGPQLWRYVCKGCGRSTEPAERLGVEHVDDAMLDHSCPAGWTLEIVEHHTVS